MRTAWTIDNTHPPIMFGDAKYTAAKLIELALATCELCPVQWDCASFAIQTEADCGTWGMRIGHLRRLARQPDWFERIEQARTDGVPVQVMARSVT